MSYDTTAHLGTAAPAGSATQSCTIKPLPQPRPCPSCGRCPTCGHTRPPYQVWPYPGPIWISHYQTTC